MHDESLVWHGDREGVLLWRWEEEKKREKRRRRKKKKKKRRRRRRRERKVEKVECGRKER